MTTPSDNAPPSRREFVARSALGLCAVALGRVDPHVLSRYRSVDEQAWLWEGALAKSGDPEIACLWVARPGTSAHQSGRAIDCHLGDPIESEYVDAMRAHPTYRWLVTHATCFGFYAYDLEPWHWEYNPPSSPGASRT